MAVSSSGKEEEPSAKVACSKMDGRRLDRLCIRVDLGDHVKEARVWWNFDASVKSYRWTARWRTDNVGTVEDKGRGHWKRGDLSGRKRRSDGCSRKSRGCSVSVALWKGHERLRTTIATTVAVEKDVGYDHKGSSFGGVGEKLSLDNEERKDNLS
ncbi:hypothetical protein B296_00017385 [Ensete ventricosum]|uniref:Uncharacterized protein n=1 Tax=Ensete ventricosum TaxID=4639 RepID=A0A426ZX62_ENSVE|nr:hypothetical protein B296_00017385 [Ensete ventricosum]